MCLRKTVAPEAAPDRSLTHDVRRHLETADLLASHG